MILLIDADSLIFASCYKKREDIFDDPYYTDIEDCINKFDSQLTQIINELEDIYTIDKVLIFNGSKGNFRNHITNKYKANRVNQNRPPLLSDMHNFVKEKYNSIYEYGVETDDVVAKYWNKLSYEVGRDNVMIVSIDKDYRQFPAIIYNYHYKHKEILDISEEDALYNFYEQMIVGDTADNVNYFKGKGKKFAQKYLADCVTEYQFIKKLFLLFKEKYKSKAREKYIECYNLLKLKTY